jgi:hypothetical protein
MTELIDDVISLVILMYQKRERLTINLINKRWKNIYKNNKTFKNVLKNI